jgi:putative NIF3 family GTP cyclohydrolase 1 type 2
MKASELHDYLDTLRTAGPYPEPTVDTFKAGDPDVEIRGIAVGWMAYTWSLRRAIELGCNLFITHEPTYFDHYDANPEVFELPGAPEKRTFIEASGLTILRCHDVWDQVPGVGVGDAWGTLLGFENPVDGDQFLRVYEIPPVTAEALASRIADRLAPMGMPGVHLGGPGDAVITRIVTGTGAITPFPDMIRRFGANGAVTTDDGTHYWRDCGIAIDLGIPIIVAHHAVSEEPGVANLARHLRSRFPDIPVHHIAQSCMYRLVGPQSPGGEPPSGGGGG